MQSFVGYPVSTLVSAWGPPQSSYTLPDGSQVIEYRRSSNMQLGGYSYTTPQTTYHQGSANAYNNTGGYAAGTYTGTSTTYVTQTTPVTNVALQCVARFTISEHGVVKNWSWQGNDCVASK